jgi:hypothetical protein
MKQLLPRKALSVTYIFVCECVCVSVCAPVVPYICVHACVCECGWVGSLAHTCASLFSALLTQHAKCSSNIVICGLFGSTGFFQHYLINGLIFGKNFPDIKCVFWFSLQLLYKIVLILRRIQSDIVTNVNTSSCNVPFILVRFSLNLNYPDRF